MASKWDGYVAEPLCKLVRSLPLLPGGLRSAVWRQLPPSTIIRDCLLYGQARGAAGAHQPFLAPCRRGAQPVAPPAPGVPEEPSPTDSSCSDTWQKTDFVLTVDPEEGPQAAQPAAAPDAPQHAPQLPGVPLPAGPHAGPGTQPAPTRRSVCVGVVKVAARLMTGYPQAPQPMGLLQVWGDEGSPDRAQARAAISQVFTYMQLGGMCYGFITCYFCTWWVRVRVVWV